MIQPYAKGDYIANGDTMTKHFMGSNHTMRDWWKYMASRKGWITAMDKIDKQPSGEAVIAYINRNRWIAYCECESCEIVNPVNPVFFCTNCMNSHNDELGQSNPPRPVRFPKDWHGIEEVLLRRPNPKNRNWETQETIDDLVKENIDHGLDNA